MTRNKRSIVTVFSVLVSEARDCSIAISQLDQKLTPADHYCSTS